MEGGPARPNNEKEMALTNLTNGLAPKSRPYTWSGRGGTWRRSLASLAFAWPWFDGASEWALRRFFFPTSRLWAAARTADGLRERAVSPDATRRTFAGVRSKRTHAEAA